MLSAGWYLDKQQPGGNDVRHYCRARLAARPRDCGRRPGDTPRDGPRSRVVARPPCALWPRIRTVILDTWRDFYDNEPVTSALTPEQEALILGGEGNLWGEQVRRPARRLRLASADP